MNNPPFVFGYCLGTHESSREKYKRDLSILVGRAQWIRGYGMEAPWNAHRMAKEMGFSTAVGAWLGSDPSANERELLRLIAEAKASYVDLAIIGSETILRKELCGLDLARYMQRFKKAVKEIPVMACDDVNDLLKCPEVLDVCDVIGAQIYPYWNGVSIEKSMDWTAEKYRQIKELSVKEVLVAETGWPSGGNAVDKAVPNEKNASRYFEAFVSWAGDNHIRYFYFAPFDESWKIKYEGPQGAHWGRWYEDRTEKR
ncbi:MAG: glycosyl hydrolase [Parcubacteria group bacterium]|nr:glycosyl hydrolase [Parcubacteria group bacterium]